MTLQETVIQILVIVGVGIFFYSKLKGQTIKETIREIKELFTSGENE